MLRLLLLAAIGLATMLAGCAHSLETERQPAALASPLSLVRQNIASVTSNGYRTLSASEQQIYQKLLLDSLSFYNTHLRNPASGQYLDSIYVGSAEQNLVRPVIPITSSSVSATGMGLVSLTVADAIGSDPQAYEKVLQSLRFVLGYGNINGTPYIARRAKNGWFRHWFDIETGADNTFTRADGFSTIDTAILVAGAQFAANYFESIHKDPLNKLRILADELLVSIDWGSAVADMEYGYLFLNYDAVHEQPLGRIKTFNEYVIVGSMGALAEKRQQREGLMTQFWRTHLASTKNLPKIDYEGYQLLTDGPNHYLSSFIMQFASYLSGDVGNSAEYLKYFSNTQKADQKWFENETKQTALWGLGAGETRFYDAVANRVQSYYHADRIQANPQLMVSPHIIAGFLPVHPEGIKDLLNMYSTQTCYYEYENLSLLWRCSLIDLKLSMSRLQAIDYSSMILGLSSYHPKLGFGFFQKYAPRAF